MSALRTSPLQVLSALVPSGKPYLRVFWLTLIVFAVLYGLLLARITAPYHRVGLAYQWGHSAWIAPMTDSAVSYYRREWTIDSSPSHAYIQVQAPDSLTVYVNGFAAGMVEKSSTAAFDILDVGNYLSAGRNVIAIRVERKTFPGSAGLLANLRWQDKNGLRHELLSDEKWRVSLREERQSGGVLSWYEPDFDDSEWSQAIPHKSPGYLTVSPAHPWAGPTLFQAFPRGAWISNNHTTTGGVSFLRQFDLASPGSGGIRSAWLGVSSTASYTLTINGARSLTMGPSNQYMDTYNIGSFLFAGKNTIEINSSNLDGIGRLAVAAMVDTPLEVLDISSNEDWQVRDSGTGWQPAVAVGGLASYPYLEEQTGQVYLTPILRLAEVALPGGLLLRKSVEALPWIAGVFLITLTLIVLRLAKAGIISREIISTCTLPWVLADVALCAIFLLPFDIRISEAQVFNLPVALAIATLVCTLFLLIMSEIAHGHN